MREIKFRFYDNKVKEMIVPTKNERKDIILEKWEFNPKASELMQYTGLKDVNGVEIYEGDILKSYEENQPTYTRDSGGGITDLDFEGGHIQIGIVEFISCSFSYKTVRTITGEHQHKEIPIDWLDNYEVIGNVHEYPELLGDSQ